MFTKDMSRQEIVIPHLTWIDNDNEDPQMIMQRYPNTCSLYIDSRYGFDDFAPSNDIVIVSNNGTPSRPPIELIKNSRRCAIKHLQLFYFLDNVIAGYNDMFQFALQINPPDPPQYRVVTVTIPNGVYASVADLGTALQTAINAWFVANWGSVPIPVATVTFNAPTLTNVLGSLTLTVDTFGLTVPLVGINPDSTFIINSGDMVVLSANNAWPNPIDTDPRINFFSLTAYSYIDIVSSALTRNSKLLSTSNTNSNYTLFHRIFNPTYGINEYDFTEPLNWVNLSRDDTLFQIDFRFVDSFGKLIQSAVTRNFWWVMQITITK